jgi:large subunit ribosomal protein L25
MTRQTITAQTRTVVGRAVKNLRNEGLVPANIFGKGIESKAVSVNAKEFSKVFKIAGETGLIDLVVGDNTHHVLVSEFQIHPVTGQTIHVDFHEVNLKEKVQATVPVHVIGESPAVKSGIGNLLQQIDEIEVEALPTELPDHFDVDISNLTEIDQAIYVKDIASGSSKVEVLTDAELIVVKIEAPQKEVVIEETPATVAEEAATPATEEATDDKKEEAK